MRRGRRPPGHHPARPQHLPGRGRNDGMQPSGPGARTQPLSGRLHDPGRGPPHPGSSQGSRTPSPAPSNPEQHLDSLLTLAAKQSETQERRSTAMRQVIAHLQSEEGWRAENVGMKSVWQRLLALLSDRLPALRQSAAVGVGLVGAAASKTTTDLPRSILFDWSLSILDGKAGESVDLGSRFWALTALREGMAAMDVAFLRQWAAAVFAMCERLLDSEKTPPALLGPLLGVTSQAARHETAIKARVRLLTDILLGWALDAELPEGVRGKIAATIVSFHKGWPSDLNFTVDLVTKLLTDMEKLVKENQEASFATLKPLLGFSTCIAATCRACVEANKQIFTGFLELFQRCMQAMTLATKTLTTAAQKSGHAQTHQLEFASHADTLMTIAAQCSLAGRSPTVLGTIDSVEAQEAETQQGLYASVCPFVLTVLSDDSAGTNSQQAVLQLHLRLLQLCELQGSDPEATVLTLLLADDSPFMALRCHPNPVIVRLLALNFRSLMHQHSENTFTLCLAALSKPLTSPSGVCSGEGDDGESAKLCAPAQTQESASSALHAGETPPGLREILIFTKFDREDLLRRFSLKVFEHIIGGGKNSHNNASRSILSIVWQAFLSSLEAGEAMELLAFLRKHLCSDRITKLEMALDLCKASDRLCSSPSLKLAVMDFLKVCLLQPATAKASNSSTTPLTEQPGAAAQAEVTNGLKAARGVFKAELAAEMGDAEVEERISLPHTDATLEQQAMTAVMQYFVDATKDPEAQIRQSAVDSLLDLISQSDVMHIPVLAKRRLVFLACYGSDDANARVQSSWRLLLLALCKSEEVSKGWHNNQQWWTGPQSSRKIAVNPAANLASPETVLHWVESLSGASVLKEKGQQNQLDWSAWVLAKADELLKDAPKTSFSRTFPGWLVAQEAAVLLVACRLRTPKLSPMQLFGFLEKSLHHFLRSVLAFEGNDAQTCWRNGWLLLEFFFCLEKALFNAYGGSVYRTAPPDPVISYFTGIKRACEEWFSRIRPLLLRLASACGHHTAVVAHSHARLGDLQAHARNLASETKAAESSQAKLAASSVSSSSDSLPKLLLKRSDQKEGAQSTPLQRVIYDVNSTSQKAARAMLALSDGPGIQGLHQHSLRAFKVLDSLADRQKCTFSSVNDLLVWMGPLPDQATGRMESAIQKYQTIVAAVKEGIVNMTNESAAVMSQLACEAYSQVADWSGLEAFMADTKEMERQVPGWHLPSQISNRHLAMLSSDKQNYKTAQGLIQISQWADETPKAKPSLAAHLDSVIDGAIARSLLTAQQIENARQNSRVQNSLQRAIQESEDAVFVRLSVAEIADATLLTQATMKLGIIEALKIQILNSRDLESRELVKPIDKFFAQPESLSYTQLACLNNQHLLSLPAVDAYPSYSIWKARLSSLPTATLSPSERRKCLLELASLEASNHNWKFSQDLLERASGLLHNAHDTGLKMTEAQILLAQARSSDGVAELESLCKEQPTGSSPEQLSRCYLLLSVWSQDVPLQELAVGKDVLHSEQGSTSALLSKDCRAEDLSALRLIETAVTACPQDPVAHAAISNWLHNLLNTETIQVGRRSVLADAAVKASASRLRVGSRFSRGAQLAAPELLRVLKCIQEYEVPSMCDHMVDIPVTLWKPLVPQLVSMLSSEQEGLAESADLILQQLEEAAPAAVLYAVMAHDGTEEFHNALRAVLRSKDPIRLQQTESMIAELKSITVLCNEEWSSIIQDIQVDVSRRVRDIEAEIARLNDQGHLTSQSRDEMVQERFVAIMAPAAIKLHHALQHWRSTRRENAHDSWFARSFIPALEAALQTMRNPHRLALEPKTLLAKLKAISKAVKGSLSAPGLKLADIAMGLTPDRLFEVPLPDLSSSMDSIPGGHDSSGQTPQFQHSALSIQAFKPDVRVFHSRTRPKKIGITASDGKTYTFLLKGLEDLRLDQRLMQFQLLGSCLMTHDTRSKLGVRTFAVTPISSRAGLIQWVDNAQPVYDIYCNWRKFSADRHALIQQEQAKHEGSKHNNNAQPQRGGDVFYAKLLPALEAAGVDKLAGRAAWPAEVLKSVLLSLQKEVPKNLLERQLWSGSISFQDWWTRQNRHASSMATTSLMGHLIGLGDRHLANILLDRDSGELIHIDYNVVFEQGRKLPVPELVPFRLTNILQGSLGLGSVEGTFTASCERMLACVRRNKEALLLMMRQILEDPLLDWEPKQKDTSANRAMEVGVRLNLVCSRVDEILPVLSSQLATISEPLEAAILPWSQFVACFTSSVAAAESAQSARLEMQQAQGELEKAKSSLQEEWQRAQTSAQLRSEKMGLVDASLQAMQTVAADLSQQYESSVAKVKQETTLVLPGSSLLLQNCTVRLGIVEAADSQETEALLGAFLRKQPTADLDLSTSLLENLQLMDQQMSTRLQDRDAAVIACHNAVMEHCQVVSTLMGESYWQSSCLYQMSRILGSTSSVNSDEEASLLLLRSAAQQVLHGSSDEELKRIWQALQAAQESWQKSILTDDSGSTPPLSILRADSRSATQSLGMIPTMDPHLAVSSFRYLFLCLQEDLGGICKATTMEQKLGDVLSLGLRASACLQALAMVPGQQQQAVETFKQRLRAVVASAAGLKTALTIGLLVFAPEVEAFATAYSDCAAQPQCQASGKQYEYLAQDADALTQSAWESHKILTSLEMEEQDADSTMGLSDRNHSTDIEAETRLKTRIQELLSDFEAAVEGGGRAMGGRGLFSVLRVPQPSLHGGLAEAIRSILSVLYKLKTPMAESALVAGPADLPPLLQAHAYELACIRLASNLRHSVFQGQDTEASASVASSDGQAPEFRPPLQARDVFLQFSDQVIDSIIAPTLHNQVKAVLDCLGEESEASGGVTAFSNAPQSVSATETSTSISREHPEVQAAARASKSLPEPRKARDLISVVEAFSKTQTELHTEEYKVRPRELQNMIGQQKGMARRHQAACEWLSNDVWQTSLSSDNSALLEFTSQGKIPQATTHRQASLEKLGVATEAVQEALQAAQQWEATMSQPWIAKLLQGFHDSACSPAEIGTLQDLLEERQHWLAQSNEKACQVLELAESVQALEYSRGGMHAASSSQVLESNLKLLHIFCDSLQEAHRMDAQIADARSTSTGLHKLANEASSRSQAAQNSAQMAGQDFVSLAPSLVELTLAMKPAIWHLVSCMEHELEMMPMLVKVLEELCGVCKAEDSLQECWAKATRLKELAEALLSELDGLKAAGTDIDRSAGEIASTQQSHTQFGEIVMSAEQETVSAAARIIDLFKPVVDNKFSGKWPDLLQVQSLSERVLVDLKKTRELASAAALNIQEAQFPMLEGRRGTDARVDEAPSDTTVQLEKRAASRQASKGDPSPASPQQGIDDLASQLSHLGMPNDVTPSMKQSSSEPKAKPVDSYGASVGQKTGPRKASEVPPGDRDARQRAFAKVTMQRFQAKLDGTFTKSAGHGEPTKECRTMSIEEQVKKLIQQASDPGRLALMYEGWTPWI